MTDIGKLLEAEEIKTPPLSHIGKYEELICKPEKLRLICNKCNFGASKEWIELRPAGYYVRYEKGNNFLINRHSPYDKKLFECPRCKSQQNIGRLPVLTKIIKT